MSYKDIKVLIVDLKLVYKATIEESCATKLRAILQKWGKKYLRL